MTLIFGPTAQAFCNNLPRLICAEYSNSDAVVIAKPTHTRHVVPEREEDGYIYTLVTNRVLRGEIGSSFRIYEENSSGRAGFTWTRGESYLLFLKRDADGTFYLYGCGNSAPERESEFTLKVIESVKTRHGGLIHGLVVGWAAPSSGVNGITVQIHGDKRSYAAATDKAGQFKIHVPAGRYEVVPIQDGWSFEKDIFSFEDPKKVEIEDGGCAQVQFIKKGSQKPISR